MSTFPNSYAPRSAGGAGLTELLARMINTAEKAPPPNCSLCKDELMLEKTRQDGTTAYESCSCTRLQVVGKAVTAKSKLEIARQKYAKEREA
jgi:hypothetical protein